MKIKNPLKNISGLTMFNGSTINSVGGENN